MELSTPRTLVTGGSGFIGTNLVAALLESGRAVRNLSRTPPRDPGQGDCFRAVDVLDAGAVAREVESFGPDEIVHLAARTDFVTRDDPEGFRVNTLGTRHVAEAAAALGSEVRCIFASSYVAGVTPEDPSGRRYGDSKLAAERVASEVAPGSWCVVRPCAVWGPWFDAPFRGFFLAVAAGRYVHPGRDDPAKLLGYVGNVASQIVGLLEAPEASVEGQTFYLADDEATTLRQWAGLIASHLGVREPRTLPGPLISLAARCGDLLGRLGWSSPPLTSVRLANMRRDTSGVPMDPIRAIAGRSPYTMEQGVERTIEWMRRESLIA